MLALPGAAATAAALREEGVDVTDVPDPAAAADRTPGAVLLATPEEAAGWQGVPRVAGAPEPPGARLLDVVAVMDRLRSPGGCPWDAEQTHASLRGYLLEEAHEAYDAIVDDDPVAMREELGDVLLQVAFHARVAAEAGRAARSTSTTSPVTWSTSWSAGTRTCSATPARATSPRSRRGWEEIKQAEKQRRSPTEGVVPLAAGHLVGRGAGRRAPAAPGCPRPPAGSSPPGQRRRSWGSELLGIVVAARQRGWDAEDALRDRRAPLRRRAGRRGPTALRSR